MTKTLKITQVRSQIGQSQRHRGTLRAETGQVPGRVADEISRILQPHVTLLLPSPGVSPLRRNGDAAAVWLRRE